MDRGGTVKLRQFEMARVDLEPLRDLSALPSELFGERDHYRLLAYLSTLVPRGRSIVDIGTCRGNSALSLSYSGHVVESFDVAEWPNRPSTSKIRYHLEDLFDPKVRQEYERLLLESAIILIDIAPHVGTQELELVEWLREKGYEGLVVLDDIWWYKEMRDNLWYRIEPRFRTDATVFGHWSGTGIVSFKNRVELEGEPDTSNWTVVTGYFDLTQRSDASEAIRSRSSEWYIEQHGSSMLSLDQNMVIFCDPDFEERIWRARPSWLHAKTRVTSIPFESLPLTKHWPRIVKNRGGNPNCPSDPRDTASYYLFCMSRYTCMRAAIRENPFKSTHFAWIDLGIERMGFNNLVQLNGALGVQRDRFSTCFIDYLPKDLVSNLPEYFGGSACYGRCSMASGVFTGRADYMLGFCDEIEFEFLRCLEAGFGHADEQLYPLVYFKKPELFDWYCGDYTEVITNYAGVRERPEAPIRNLIRNSLAAGDLKVCKKANDILLDSFWQGRCALRPSEYSRLQDVRGICG